MIRAGYRRTDPFKQEKLAMLRAPICNISACSMTILCRKGP